MIFRDTEKAPSPDWLDERASERSCSAPGCLPARNLRTRPRFIEKKDVPVGMGSLHATDQLRDDDDHDQQNDAEYDDDQLLIRDCAGGKIALRFLGTLRELREFLIAES